MHYKKYLTWIILISLMIFGALASYAKAPYAFGTGDHMLFHAFGHWIANGEVFTRDFIHFRTPGPYYYYGLLQSLFGQTFRVTSTALLMESHVFQLLAGFVLTLVFTRNILGKPSLSLATAVGIFFIITPPIYQLRTALPALSLACYLYSINNEEIFKKRVQLFASGILLGLSFWFGQELFIFLSLSIFVAEFSFGNKSSLKEKTGSILCIGIAALAVILAGLLFFYANGVSIREFLYNTLYYAFVIQPKGMDVAFPALSSESLVYYTWIMAYLASILIFALSKKLYTPSGIVFTAYASLRLISMFGRVDVLHLLFSISEIFIFATLALRLLPTCLKNVTKSDLLYAIAITAISAIVVMIAAKGKSSIFLVIPFILLALSYAQKRELFVYDFNPVFNFIFAAVGLVLSAWMLNPLSVNTIKFTYSALFSKPTNTFLGVQLPANVRQGFEEVEKVLAEEKAHSIFSYPIRAEFYALSKNHGTRFIEFAPQTTPDDVSGAINDLKKNKPDIVIQDLDQTAFLSPILFDLSNFVYENYEPIKVIQSYSNFEIYKLKSVGAKTLRLYDNVYRFNTDHTDTTAGLRTTQNGTIVPVIATNKKTSLFKIAGDTTYLHIQVYPEPGASTKGIAIVKKGQDTITREVSVADGDISIALPSGEDELEINLKSAEDGKSVLWLNPLVELSGKNTVDTN